MIMVLAQADGYPEGRPEERLEMRVCLTQQGTLDDDAWAFGPDPWRAVRVRPDLPQQAGEVVRTAACWALRDGEGDDAPLTTLSVGLVRPGEIVTLTDPGAEPAQFRIVSVEVD